MKVKHPIGPKKKHYQDKKRVIVHDENVVTPPNKSRKCNNNNSCSSVQSVLKDNIKTCSRPNTDFIQNLNELVMEMADDSGPMFTAILLLTKAVEVLHSVHDNREAVKELVINIIRQQVAVESQTATPQSPPGTVPVVYDKDIFHYHQLTPGLRVCLETAKSNRKRAKKRLRDALDSCGSLQHQMFLIHKVMSTGDKAGIGLGLGLLDSRITDDRAIRKMVICIDDILHSDLVLGGTSNDSIGFQKTIFLLLSTTAPKQDAADEVHEQHDMWLRIIGNLLLLNRGARERMKEMSIYWHDLLGNLTGQKMPLMQ